MAFEVTSDTQLQDPSRIIRQGMKGAGGMERVPFLSTKHLQDVLKNQQIDPSQQSGGEVPANNVIGRNIVLIMLTDGSLHGKLLILMFFFFFFLIDLLTDCSASCPPATLPTRTGARTLRLAASRFKSRLFMASRVATMLLATAARLAGAKRRVGVAAGTVVVAALVPGRALVGVAMAVPTRRFVLFIFFVLDLTRGEKSSYTMDLV